VRLGEHVQVTAVRRFAADARRCYDAASLRPPGGSMARVLVLQHTPFETPGTIGEVLESLGFELETARLYAGDPVPVDIGAAAALVVMGGPMGVYETDVVPFMRGEIEFVRRAVDAGVPTLGICLGSQILATALGGSVSKGSHKEIGWSAVELSNAASTDPLFRNTPRTWTVFHWHGDQITPPPGSTLLASSGITPCQAFRHGTSSYGLQFHPEVTEAIVDGMVGGFHDELAEEGIPADAIRAGVSEYLVAMRPICVRMASEWVNLWAAAAS
jgi:GMP synthase (glutamine-hydrolysing)